MKAAKVREMGAEELKTKERELQEQLFRLRVQQSIGQLDNGIKLRQTRREIAQRFDFKDTGTSISQDDKLIEVRSGTEDRLKAAIEVLKEKAVKREITYFKKLWKYDGIITEADFNNGGKVWFREGTDIKPIGFADVVDLQYIVNAHKKLG